VAQIVLRYRKGEQVRWISHLDLKRTLERAMRRAKLPLALTQGHNPHPKLSLGPPLPLGVSSDAELLALHLAEAMSPAEVKERLNAQLPEGLEVLEIWAIPGYRKKETFGEIEVAEYLATLRGPHDKADLQTRVEKILAEPELTVQRGGERPERTVNVRPLILGLNIVEPSPAVGSATVAASGGCPGGGGAPEPGGACRAEEIAIRMRLRTGSHGGARPQEIVSFLGLAEEDIAAYHRSGLYALPTQAPAPGAGRRRWHRPRGITTEEG
jgi:radical SAM-linked protein